MPSNSLSIKRWWLPVMIRSAWADAAHSRIRLSGTSSRILTVDSEPSHGRVTSSNHPSSRVFAASYNLSLNLELLNRLAPPHQRVRSGKASTTFFEPSRIIPDSAVDHGPSRHSRVLQAGIQASSPQKRGTRRPWMPASAGMTPLFPKTVLSSHHQLLCVDRSTQKCHAISSGKTRTGATALTPWNPGSHGLTCPNRGDTVPACRMRSDRPK